MKHGKNRPPAKKAAPYSHPHDRHRQRMRYRYRKEGIDGFADHEVLEMLLYYCYPREDTNVIAHRMLNEFGTLYNLFNATVGTLMSTLGCTERIAVFLNMMSKTANRYRLSRWDKNVALNNIEVAASFVIDLFVGCPVERFYVICLNKRYQLINTVLISEGTIDETAVYLREIIIAATENYASRIILAHNHPGGSTSPSNDDVMLTRKIFDGVSFLNLEITDHIISVGDTYYSFASKGEYVDGWHGIYANFD